MTVNGSGSWWSNSSNLHVGHKGAGTLNVQNGGVVTTFHGLIGRFAGSTGTVTVTGSGSQWINAPYLFVGHEGTGTLNVTAGGVVTAEHGAIGTVSGSSGTATVTGNGSQWNNTGSLIVGHVSNGILNVTAGGVVTNPVGFVGNEAGSTGTVTVTGSGSQWNNSDALHVGRFGNGTLNIADGGSVTVVNLTAIDAGGQINNSDGGFVSNTVINQVGGEILGRGFFSAVGGWSNSGFMAFRGGVSNVYGPVNNLAGGTIFAEFFGTTYFHGDVVHNGNQIAVGAGSRIEFQATVSGAGNYFSGGTVAMNGTFRPGNGPGVVSVANELSFGAGASLEIEIGGLTAGSQHDKLNVGNNLALNGELEVSLINGFIPSAGQSFNILDWGSLTGTFSSISLPTLAGLTWNTSQLYTTGVISVASAGLSGDFNNDGAVDAADFVAWRKTSGTPAGYDVWRANFGATLGGGSSQFADLPRSSAIPEPTSALLCLSFAAIGTWGRRRGFHRPQYKAANRTVNVHARNVHCCESAPRPGSSTVLNAFRRLRNVYSRVAGDCRRAGDTVLNALGNRR